MKFLDSAYPLLPNLMTPFKTPGSDVAKLMYNLVHSRTRQKIEHSFGFLTSRWRFLWKHLYLFDLLRIAKTIYACCVLHNICLDEGDPEEGPVNLEYEGFIEANRRGDDGVEVTVNDHAPDNTFIAPTATENRHTRNSAEQRRFEISRDINS